MQETLFLSIYVLYIHPNAFTVLLASHAPSHAVAHESSKPCRARQKLAAAFIQIKTDGWGGEGILENAQFIMKITGIIASIDQGPLHVWHYAKYFLFL